MDATERTVRKFVFDYFLSQTTAPSPGDIAQQLQLPLPEVKAVLRRLDDDHHLKLLEGTSRILMAFPFSAVASPFRVTRPNGMRYFANCAWDSIAFHPMLQEPIQIDSFCDDCGKPLRFRIVESRGVPVSGELPRVHIMLPAQEWWKDITRTCSNTMVFLGPEETERIGVDGRGPATPGVVTVDQVVAMSVPIYSGKLNLEYDRPPPSAVQSAFERLGLSGAYWKL